jgi:four helix bundle protein
MLSIAKGSCAEVRSLLYACLDGGYLEASEFDRLNELTLEVSRVIGGLRAAVARQRDADRAS